MSGDLAITYEAGNGPDGEAINAGLIAWNDRMTGPARRVRFAYAVRDAKGKLLGGVTAKIYRDSLYVDDLFLDDAVRSQGIGTRLMDLAEAKAREAGCAFAYLDTMEWQARPFYEKRGYTVIYEFSYEGGKHRSFCMRKDFS
jgi:GNAT superfamily N-acetyltransferase